MPLVTPPYPDATARRQSVPLVTPPPPPYPDATANWPHRKCGGSNVPNRPLRILYSVESIELNTFFRKLEYEEFLESAIESLNSFCNQKSFFVLLSYFFVVASVKFSGKKVYLKKWFWGKAMVP